MTEFYRARCEAVKKRLPTLLFPPSVVAPVTFEGLPAVATDFDVAALRQAILDSQQKGQTYREFSQRAMRAGVQSYFAFLQGTRVTYLGRQGDQHIEWFPGAEPKANLRD